MRFAWRLGGVIGMFVGCTAGVLRATIGSLKLRAAAGQFPRGRLLGAALEAPGRSAPGAFLRY